MRPRTNVSFARIIGLSAAMTILGLLHHSKGVNAAPSCTSTTSTTLAEIGVLADIGDVNSDGYADIILTSSQSGVTQVISGKDGATLFEITPPQLDSSYSHSVASVPDLTGDGFPDILISAPWSTDVWQLSGRVDVFDGQTGAFLYKVIATEPGALHGWTVAGIGDINADGFGDFVVGAPENTTNAYPNAYGDAYVYSGVDGELLYNYAGAADNYLGKEVAGIGDANNDGVPDFALSSGSSLDASVSVYSGSNGLLLYVLSNGSSAGQFGSAISTAGDLDSDGHSDILIGAFGVDAAYVFSGQTGALMFSFSPEITPDLGFFGISVTGGEDVDGDGIPDIAIGSPLADNDAGKVYLFSGADQSSIGVFTGLPNQKLGWYVSLPGDINGDCLSDVVAIDRNLTHIYSLQNSCARPAACTGCCNIPGDANNDGSFNVADVTFGISRIFSGGGAPACQDKADANGDNAFNIADVTFGITRIFGGGPPPICGTSAL